MQADAEVVRRLNGDEVAAWWARMLPAQKSPGIGSA
jgi:hypothetical protein